MSSAPAPVRGLGQIWFFSASVFLSAFLLFSVQPMVAKYLLPSFGGTAGVWATCLAVFQLLLLAGYAYAHWLSRLLNLRAQRLVHLGVMGVAMLFLPIAPRVHVSGQGIAAPVWQLVWTLAGSVGLPFLALSATAPLLMEWFRHAQPQRTPDRLYALSNAGSLLALLLYPTVIDPLLTRSNQGMLWACGMALFLGLCAATAWLSQRTVGHPPGSSKGVSVPSAKLDFSPRVAAPAWLWVLLPACGSGLLLALTNQICQDVTPVPLLWVAPMGIYLLTFILCFEGSRIYRRGWFLPACMACLVVLSWMLYYGGMQPFAIQLAVYLVILFVGCMVCHGELYRIRPEPQKLTKFYLCVAVGGAVGGTLVAIVAPLLFRSVLETPILTLLVGLLVTFLVWRDRARIRFGRMTFPAGPAALVGSLATLFVLGWVVHLRQQQSIYWTRSFYGVYQVKEGPTWLINNIPFKLDHGPGRVLVSGQVYHGFQFLDPAASRYPTTYYSPESGLGVALQELPKQSNRWIGAVGLGTGTLAAYARPGDRIRFYELNPDVLRIAQRQFTFLSSSLAKIDVVLGDGRLSLERESAQQFDLLVLDAFSGDSIPTHLLTKEAMKVYLRHLGPNGVIAFHISNNHLDLEPVVRALAMEHGLNAVLVPPTNLEPSTGKLSSIWMLLSSSEAFCARPVIAQLLSNYARSQSGRPLLWTDDHFSILPILR